MPDRLSILVIDDDEVDRIEVRRTLRSAGFTADVYEAATVSAALAQLNERVFDCIFLDFNLPDGTGLEVLRRLNLAAYRAPVIVLTGQGDEETAVQLMKAGASDYIVKSGASAERLKSTVPAVLRLFRAEQGLRDAEERLRLAVDAAQIGTWEFNPSTETLTWSDRCKEFFGLPPHAGVDYDLFRSLVHPEDVERVDRAVQSALDPKVSSEIDLEYRVIWPDRSLHWLRSMGRAFFRGSADAPLSLRLIGTVTDVTRQKENEEAISRYAQQLRALADASLAINAALTVQDRLHVITEEARTIIGAHQAVTSLSVGSNWSQALNSVSLSEKYARYRPYDARPDGAGIFAMACDSNRPVRFTHEELLAHPKWRGFGQDAADRPPLRGWLAAPLVARDGSNLGLIQLSDRLQGDFTAEDEAILVQLAQLASVAIENAQLFERVQEAVRTREDVLAIVSHDLRNPLNTILANASLITDIPLGPDQQQKHLEIIKRTGHQMNRLLQDLLDVARMDARRFTVDPKPIDPRGVLNDICTIFEHLVSTNDQTLICDVVEDLPLVNADRERLAQVFSNLISNAARFTPRGGQIRITSELADDAIRFGVADTGAGIPAEDLPHVFERFWQAHRARRTGAGLGLAIVKGIIEAHGGRIWVESRQGEGAAFYFDIPLAAASVTVEQE